MFDTVRARAYQQDDNIYACAIGKQTKRAEKHENLVLIKRVDKGPINITIVNKI